jgi:hypothetical protein
VTRKRHLTSLLTAPKRASKPPSRDYDHNELRRWPRLGGRWLRVRTIWTTVRHDKCLVRPPTDNFRRLLEEACPNHVYPIRHRLKDCGMIRSSMTSGSLA